MAPKSDIEFAETSKCGEGESNNGTEIAIFPAVRSCSAEERGSYDPTSDNDTELEQEDLSNKKEQDTSGYGSQDSVQDTEVVWEYLTFETELPHPTSIHPTQTGQELPPEPPNLTKFTNPFDWSEKRKNFTIWISCVITALTAFTAGAYSPGIGQMTEEWGVSDVAALVGITTFTTGFAVAPMVLAPFSEINGRRPVFIASGILFVICQLGTGLTRSYAGMLVVRFFVGVGGSTFSTMVGGVVSDIYHAEHRNTPMALFSGSALFGTGFGPLVCGFIAQNTTWRWIFYMQTISCGTMVALICVIFKETRGSVLLSQKAKTLNKWYEARESAGYYGFNVPNTEKPSTTISQRIRWKVKTDEERASLHKMIGISLYRPFHLLLTEPVVFWFSLWVAFSWAVLYLTLAAIPLVFQNNHGFSLQQANAVFAAMCVGSILATVLSIYQEKIARKYGKLITTPEGRLYFACVESACMPIGLFMFGWTSFADIHWIVPAIAISIATIGIFAIYLSTFNYLADTYHRYASSALAAQSFCRNILGGVFPLITTQMYNRLGYGPASSLLGGIGTLLTIVPWILVFYGPRIRARSKFASEIMNNPG
ncbi:Nn.00g035140.m01.CDS01 [Neocucurbitaria sp. VM-36]